MRAGDSGQPGDLLLHLLLLRLGLSAGIAGSRWRVLGRVLDNISLAFWLMLYDHSLRYLGGSLLPQTNAGVRARRAAVLGAHEPHDLAVHCGQLGYCCSALLAPSQMRPLGQVYSKFLLRSCQNPTAQVATAATLSMAVDVVGPALLALLGGCAQAAALLLMAFSTGSPGS